MVPVKKKPGLIISTVAAKSIWCSVTRRHSRASKDWVTMAHPQDIYTKSLLINFYFIRSFLWPSTLKLNWVTAMITWWIQSQTVLGDSSEANSKHSALRATLVLILWDLILLKRLPATVLWGSTDTTKSSCNTSAALLSHAWWFQNSANVYFWASAPLQSCN